MTIPAEGEQRSAPSGAVTYLFSDVVGSTRLWEGDPEAMSGSLRIHDQIMKQSIAEFGGHIFSTAGDSFGAAFAQVDAAVECADSIQKSLASADWGTSPALSVRMGLHLGEAEEREDNYFGPAVNLAARVMAAAHGGQCVFTDEVRDGAQVEALDLGVHTLRDIEAPVHLNQLGTGEFPPLWTAGVGIVSLPSPRTSLVGRGESVREVRHLLASHRLVTLTGVGGCGKTRLAIEVAYREIPTHPQGIWFVDLSSIAEANALLGAVASALSLTLGPEGDPIEQVIEYLTPRTSILLVDNCEHLIEPVADLVDLLLERCPRLQVVATSREPLSVQGEFAWKVPSLTTGADEPAVQLFVDRATATGTSVSRDPETLALISEVVERLDGIPLAIELAAARTRSMRIAEIRDLLDDRFRLLTGGTRRTHERQATLEGAVHWSYELLSVPEQSLLRTLSVFQGGFAPADVAQVAQISDLEALQLVDSLAAKSLVDLTRDASGELRHRLLETIRLFAIGKLIESGDAEAVRDRHLDQFAVDAKGATLAQWNDIGRLIRSGREYENIRAAITWAIERGRLDTAVRMAAMGTEAAARRGEAKLAIEVLRLRTDLEPRERGFALTVFAWALATQRDVGGAFQAAEHALDIGEEYPGDFMVFALDIKGTIVSIMGDIEGGSVLYRRAQDLAYQHYGPNEKAAANLFVMVGLCSELRFKDSNEVGAESLAAAPDYGWRHNIEAYRAWSLLADGRVDVAAWAVKHFSPIPPGSQWAHLNSIVAHAVMGQTKGPEVAASSLARNMKESISRRPGIGSDVLQGFAYLAHLDGDEARSMEIIHNTQPFACSPIFSWLYLVSSGTRPENAFQRWVEIYESDPAIERLIRDGENSERLIHEELKRWAT